MNFKEDTQMWKHCLSDDLWIYDKLIVSKKMGYTCGPKGVPVPNPGKYIIRPITNLLGMGIGSQFVHIEKETDEIPDGYFWSEVFTGRHISVDYVDGEQVLCVEGIRDPCSPIWKWDEWRKVDEVYPYPGICKDLKGEYQNINIEMIGGNIIEIHLRLNPDWKEDYTSVIPYFEGDIFRIPDGYRYVEDRDYKRIGFYVKT